MRKNYSVRFGDEPLGCSIALKQRPLCSNTDIHENLCAQTDCRQLQSNLNLRQNYASEFPQPQHVFSVFLYVQVLYWGKRSPCSAASDYVSLVLGVAGQSSDVDWCITSVLRRGFATAVFHLRVHFSPWLGSFPCLAPRGANSKS